jgi:hypothetical protein
MADANRLWGPQNRHYLRADKYLDERTALRLLHKPNHKLCSAHTSRGREFFIAPSGGAVSEKVAQQILSHPDIQPADPGLFNDQPQSWKLSLRR